MSDTILTDKTLESKSQEDDDENENENENVNDNVNGNKNDKTLMSSDKDNDDESENEIINKNNSDKIKELNDRLDEIINKSKLFEEQIKSLKKREDLKGYCPYNDVGDKELKFKYFKIELADMSNEIEKKLFEQILVLHLKH